MFKKSKKSKIEKANEFIGKAKQAGQQKRYKEAIEFAQKAIELLKGSEDRRRLDLARALFNEYSAEIAIKEDKAQEAASFLGRAGGFYQRLSMYQDLHKVYKKQAHILLIIARMLMKEKRFIEAASHFEQAAIAFQRIGSKADELDCKAKSFISRAAAEKTISGRKGFLRKAVELIEEKGGDEPVIRGHLAYYNALFVEDEKPEKALRYYAEALQYYQLAGLQSRIAEIKKKMEKLTK